MIIDLALACAGCGKHLMPDGSAQEGPWGWAPEGVAEFRSKRETNTAARVAGWFVPCWWRRLLFEVPGYKCPECRKNNVPNRFVLRKLGCK